MAGYFAAVLCCVPYHCHTVPAACCPAARVAGSVLVSWPAISMQHRQLELLFHS